MARVTNRALIERETVHLKREEMGIEKVTEVVMVIFAATVAATVAAIYFSLDSVLIIVSSILAFAALSALTYLLVLLGKYKGDLKDHIYEVHGPLRKKGRLSKDHRVTVGGRTFRITPSNPAAWDFYQKHQDGTPVSIYYSPRTKVVWSITEEDR